MSSGIETVTRLRDGKPCALFVRDDVPPSMFHEMAAEFIELGQVSGVKLPDVREVYQERWEIGQRIKRTKDGTGTLVTGIDLRSWKR